MRRRVLARRSILGDSSRLIDIVARWRPIRGKFYLHQATSFTTSFAASSVSSSTTFTFSTFSASSSYELWVRSRDDGHMGQRLGWSRLDRLSRRKDSRRSVRVDSDRRLAGPSRCLGKHGGVLYAARGHHGKNDRRVLRLPSSMETPIRQFNRCVR